MLAKHVPERAAVAATAAPQIGEIKAEALLARGAIDVLFLVAARANGDADPGGRSLGGKGR